MQDEVVKDIITNYKEVESSIVRQLRLKVNNHHLTAGHNREKIWLDLFRQIIPLKFAIRQGVFLIDSKGHVSKEVDIAVFDEQFTPYIFNFKNIHFIPIEAVAIAIQCKSKTIEEPGVTEWYQSIDKLQTVPGGIARMAKKVITGSPRTQKATKPINVLCHLKEEGYNNQNYDLVLSASEKKITVQWNNKIDTLDKAFLKFNGIEDSAVIEDVRQELNQPVNKLSVGNNSILSLIFQLNQLLMLINNPMLFPHQAYVNMFNDVNT